MNSNLNICIVDDDEVYQFTVAKALETINFNKNILAFYDGEEAFNYLIENLDNSSQLPDVILLDINMPIMDGFQFMEEYVKIKPKVGKRITIYMVSSSVDPYDLEKAKSISDISDYIIKPIKRGELTAIFKKLNDNGNI
ncbi:transcriptional regulator [Tamlana nanhaiensis]|uniref:Transcriptional regulator n=1 Tax=Neotamlana nanhaiensis TaxID=1382798 RepID=A0A0D7W4J3_9FLAO|nr:response regulator [Tamlana nanhaiensis]KJD33623.1 transcriptional regulator [Tamlana nanhaiensis]